MINCGETGLIKSRQADNVRHLIHIIDAAVNFQVPAAVVLLDTTKAFDRLVWSFLFILSPGGNGFWKGLYSYDKGFVLPSALVHTGQPTPLLLGHPVRGAL